MANANKNTVNHSHLKQGRIKRREGMQLVYNQNSIEQGLSVKIEQSNHMRKPT